MKALAMILAAGRGERMLPLTETWPKPLLEVGGKPLIVWQIERLVAAGFEDIVINVSHLSATLEDALTNGAAYGATTERWGILVFSLYVFPNFPRILCKLFTNACQRHIEKAKPSITRWRCTRRNCAACWA